MGKSVWKTWNPKEKQVLHTTDIIHLHLLQQQEYTSNSFILKSLPSESCWEWPTNYLCGMWLSFSHQCILCFQEVPLFSSNKHSCFSCILMLFYTFTTDISYIPEMKHMFDTFMILTFKMVLPVSVNHDHQVSTYMIF